MSKPTTISKDEARAYIRACGQLAQMKDELERLSCSPNAADLLHAIDVAIQKNAADLEKAFLEVMRAQERMNPHAEWTDTLAADVGDRVVRGVLDGLGDAVVPALILPLLQTQLRQLLARFKYAGHDAPSMKDRRKRALELKDSIARLKRAIHPPQTPADWQFVEELAGRAELEVVRRISRNL